MEKLVKEQFENWAKEHGWLCYEEVANPNGRQFNFITPTGQIVAEVINLEGQLAGVVPIPTNINAAVPGPQFRGFPGLGNLGKG